MDKNLLILIGVIVTIGFISALLTYFRSEKMGLPDELVTKGLAAVRKGNVIFYGVVMPLVVGVFAFLIYHAMLVRTPESAQASFFLMTTGIAIILTILAAVVFKRRGFFEITSLHILYVAGFGWIAPMLWGI